MLEVLVSKGRVLSWGPGQSPGTIVGLRPTPAEGTIPLDTRPSMRGLAGVLTLLTLFGVGAVGAAEGPTRTELKPYAVTIRVFDPAKGVESGQDYVLPVDSPDAEHAVASTTANAASFTKKVENGRALPVAFTCIKVEPR